MVGDKSNKKKADRKGGRESRGEGEKKEGEGERMRKARNVDASLDVIASYMLTLRLYLFYAFQFLPSANPIPRLFSL